MVNESVIGTRVSISIGGTTYDAKSSTRLQGSYEVAKDSVPAGIKKSVANRDLFLDAVIFLEVTDISRLNAANTTSSNGSLPDQAISITYRDGKGSSSTVSGTGILTDLVISDDDAEGKVTAEIHVEFNTGVTVR